MAQTDTTSTNPFDNYFQLSSLLCATFRDSDYRFGELHFAEPMDDGEYPEHLVDPPEFMRSGWTRFHEIPMVLHPEKGALLLRMTTTMRDEPREVLTARIEETHSELTNLEWKIRDRLEKLGYWGGRPIVMGVGVVTPETCPERLRPMSVDEEVIVDRRDLPRFAERIDEMFDYYTIDAARPVAEWGDRLIADITGSRKYLGGFLDEEHFLERYDDFGRPLDGAIKRAA